MDTPRLVLVLALAGLSTAALHYRALQPAAALAPFLLIPPVGACAELPAPAGVFRADTGRALYVDWKSRGQVNLLKQFAVEWRERWRSAALERYDPRKDYGALGIYYLVMPPGKLPPGAAPSFRKSAHAVIAARTASPSL